jgi:UDP-glucose 4-epimerase
LATYLITGGAGFIGSHLADSLLADGHQLRVIDDLSTGRRQNLAQAAALTVADTADEAVLARALQGAAGVFHLAAVASVQRGNEDWTGTHRVNQTGSIAVLNAARLAGLPVVYASSAAIYGDTAGEIAGEACPARPQTAYGADKYGSELHAAVGWTVHGVPSFGLRFFNVYGPRQDPASPYSGVISIFAARIARGEPVLINGDGRQTRDFIYVADVIAHLRAAMDHLAAHPGAHVANVCTGQETSILALAHRIGEVLRAPPRIVHGPARAGDIRRSLGCPARAATLLGLRASVALTDGLARLRGG